MEIYIAWIVHSRLRDFNLWGGEYIVHPEVMPSGASFPFSSGDNSGSLSPIFFKWT